MKTPTLVYFTINAILLTHYVGNCQNYLTFWGLFSLRDKEPVKNSRSQVSLPENPEKIVEDLIDSIFDINPKLQKTDEHAVVGETINLNKNSSVPEDQEQIVEDLIHSIFNINQKQQENAHVIVGETINLNKNVETSSEQNVLNKIENCKCVPRNHCKIEQIKQDNCPRNDVLCCTEVIHTTTPKPYTSPPYISSGECGIRKPDGIGFRVESGENEARFGEFAWMVAILFETTLEGNHKFNIYQCGGSLIHPKVVLTAAHCVNNQTMHKSLKIRAGEWDTQTTNELYSHQDRKVKSVHIHEEFVPGRLYNDIALLFLETPVDISENVDVVCLPPKNVQIDLSKKCIATGWGKDAYGQEAQFQVILKKVEIPYVPREDCIESLHKTRLGESYKLHESFLCAGGEQGVDTCKGDGGSPLVCPIRNKINQYQQVGIVSWGIGCGETNVPGVYVNIPSLRDWIDKKMMSNNLNQSAYTF